MGKFHQSAQRLMTGLVLLAVLATTFLPNWVSRTQAATAPSATAANTIASEASAPDAVSPAEFEAAANVPGASENRLAPMDALVFSEAGRTQELAASIVKGGGYVYARHEDALFVGLNELDYDQLAPAGARAVYEGTVSRDEMNTLASEDREMAAVWNDVAAREPLETNVIQAGAGYDTGTYLFSDEPTAESVRSQFTPNSDQTSVFLAGSVTVDVVFVESEGDGENWTANEISKAKSEVIDALNWWTVAATAPDPYEAEPVPRPPAFLTWNVQFNSPLEGTTAEKERVKVSMEPITGDTLGAQNSWMIQLAEQFMGQPSGTGSPALLRSWANSARTNGQTDWGFVLFVVDSSNDDDGRFADAKAAGAVINGPWAVVTYDAGDLGINNLEIYIAKMVGHIFGAGDEWYDMGTDEGCHSDSNESEYYGYLRVAHDNCEFNDLGVIVESIMRAGNDMVYAYQNYAISNSARGQVGWLDREPNGIYDVIDTLFDTFEGNIDPPVCPDIHLYDIDVWNIPALPSDFGPSPTGGGDENGWWSYIWNPATQSLDFGVEYQKANINHVGFVWGRINEGEWIAGTPADGVAWDEEEEGYNLILPGKPGEVNDIEIAIMNRWDSIGRVSETPINVFVPDVVTSGIWESDDDSRATLFFADGVPGGWSSKVDPGYSGSLTMIAGGAGREACFGFAGDEVTLYYNNETTGSANVYVDGELHSTIHYTNGGQQKVPHTIANLVPGKHTVSLVANNAGIDFDAFEVTDSGTANLIDALDPADVSDASGFYEDTGAKIQYEGSWAPVSPYTANDQRQGTPDDSARLSGVPNDHIYFYFTNADTVAIYRTVSPNAGSADVYLNGYYYGTMYNNSTETQVAPYYISSLSQALTYTVEIRLNPADELNADEVPRFELDALRFLNLYELDQQTIPKLYVANVDTPTVEIAYNGAQEQYGDWNENTKQGYFRSRNEGDVVNVYFKGSAIAVKTETGNRGIMELYIDGKLQRVVNNKDKKAKDTPIVIHGLEPTFPHVLQVRVVRETPSKRRWDYIYGFSVLYVAPIGEGVYQEYEYDGGVPTSSVFVYEQEWQTPKADADASGGFFIESKHRESRAFLYFTNANSLTLYAVSNGSYGVADIYVNGEMKGQFVQKGKKGYGNPFSLTGFDRDTVNVLEVRIGELPKMKERISIDAIKLFNRPLLEGGFAYENNDYEPDPPDPPPMIPDGVPSLLFSGQWTEVSDENASGGTYHLSSSPYDEVAFDVRGPTDVSSGTTSVIIYRRLYKKYGRADVYVDGVYHSSFDNSTKNPKEGVYQEPYVISGLTRTNSHRISIRPEATKKGRAKPFDIDYVEIRNQESQGTTFLENNFYENDDSDALIGQAIVYNGQGWVTDEPSPDNPNSATYAFTDTRNDRVSVVFHGNAFTVFFNKFSKGGKAEIYIDGDYKGSIDTSSRNPVYDVPFAVGGLKVETHTAEIILQNGQLQIDGFRADTFDATGAEMSYDLPDDRAPMPQTTPTFLVSGDWSVDDDGYLHAKESGAALYFYVSGGDTVFVTRPADKKTGDLDIYVDNVLHVTAKSKYLKKWPLPEEDYVVSGLRDMIDKGVWVEIRVDKKKDVRLSQVEFGELPAIGPASSVEAEGPQVYTAGDWSQGPKSASDKYSDGFYTGSNDQEDRMFIPVENVSYVTVFRTVSRKMGDAKVYIDGKYWGIMPNGAKVTEESAAFAIGPITSPAGYHVVELRPEHNRKDLEIDLIETQGMTVLSPGYYENDHEAFTGIDPDTGTVVGLSYYSGRWSQEDDDAASGGNFHLSSKKGDRLNAVFTGNKITIYRQTAKKGKYMTAYIDGKPYPINNRDKPGDYRVPFTVLLPTNGYHTLELVNDSGKVFFDAIEIENALPATFDYYQEDHPQVIINDGTVWETEESELHSDGAHVITNQKYASIFFMFEGGRVTTYFTRGKDWGKFSVYLDGEFVEELDLHQYDPKNKRAPDEPFHMYDLANLEIGIHVLELRFDGNSERKGKPRVNFDVFSVDGAPVPNPNEDNPPSDPDTGSGDPGDIVDAPKEGCFEEAHPEWFRSGDGWGQFFDFAASGGQYYFHQSFGEDIFAEFDFAAEGFGFLHVKSPTGGEAEIYLDGVYLMTLDMYSPVDLFLGDALLAYPDDLGHDPLDPGVKHVVRIVPLGTGNVAIDRMDLPVYDPIYNPENEGCQYIPTESFVPMVEQTEEDPVVDTDTPQHENPVMPSPDERETGEAPVIEGPFEQRNGSVITK